MSNSRGSHEDYQRTYDVAVSSERSFGLVFTVVFALIGGWPLFFGGTPRWWALGCAAVFLLASFLFPRVLRPLNLAWALLGRVLHGIVNPIILGVLFFGVILPTGLFMRLAGKDPLKLKFEPDATTYWIDREPPGPTSDSMENQF